MKGQPWQPGPNGAGAEVQTRTIAPASLPEGAGPPAEVNPLISRGIAVEREKHVATGPTGAAGVAPSPAATRAMNRAALNAELASKIGLQDRMAQ